MFQTFFVSSLYFLINLILDVLFTFIDPRIKLAEASQATLYNLTKSTILRFIWVQKWHKAMNQIEYRWVSPEDSLSRTLTELKSIDFKSKSVVVDENIRLTYGFQPQTKFLVIGKDILKIKEKPLLKLKGGQA